MQNQNKPKAIVILSGGMDSAVALGIACHNHNSSNVIAVTFDYGQRHAKEMNAAKALTKHYGTAEHIIFKVDMTQIGGSALTDKSIAVPEFQRDEDVWKKEHVALSYVPCRNTIFIAIAAAIAESRGCSAIYNGFNYVDSGGYPDTRPEYVSAMQFALSKGSRDKPIIASPLILKTKAEIVRLGEFIHVPWHLTWSCYKGKDHPCGKCNACVQRKKGFDEAGVRDPLEETQ